MSAEQVTRLFGDGQPAGPAESDVNPSFVTMARAIAQICATRILLLIAVLTGSGIWAYVTIDPTRDRLAAAVAYSVVFVIPQVALYWRKG